MSDTDVPVPHPSRLSPERSDYAEIVARHAHAVHQGALSYIDPASGLMVLTVLALRERGSCCHSGCRHCPYIVD